MVYVFCVDFVVCCIVDYDCYLVLSCVVIGEMMVGVFVEWWCLGLGCGGVLVWFLWDLWVGVGWGLVDDIGLFKVCFYVLWCVL